MSSRRKSVGLVLLSVGAVAAIVVATCVGVIVQQPIGSLPDGATIVYWRVGTGHPFVQSADGLQLERTGKVALLGRGIALRVLLEDVGDKRIATLPYSEWLYLKSTGGAKFER